MNRDEAEQPAETQKPLFRQHAALHHQQKTIKVWHKTAANDCFYYGLTAHCFPQRVRQWFAFELFKIV